MSDLKNVMVTLKTKPFGEKKQTKEKSFPIVQANALLKLPNPQWTLKDPKYKWNGTEIAKA